MKPLVLKPEENVSFIVRVTVPNKGIGIVTDRSNAWPIPTKPMRKTFPNVCLPPTSKRVSILPLVSSDMGTKNIHNQHMERKYGNKPNETKTTIGKILAPRSQRVLIVIIGEKSDIVFL
mmetsp:Transcript_30104/g.37115  ORF Transcript_30104/g.37115 Transcript_30104/m.37115 type:complete len:119 (+) Transcript_30104:3282-3638(+)